MTKSLEESLSFFKDKVSDCIKSKKSIILDDDLRDIFIVTLKEKNNVNFIYNILTESSKPMNYKTYVLISEIKIFHINFISR